MFRDRTDAQELYYYKRLTPEEKEELRQTREFEAEKQAQLIGTSIMVCFYVGIPVLVGALTTPMIGLYAFAALVALGFTVRALWNGVQSMYHEYQAREQQGRREQLKLVATWVVSAIVVAFVVGLLADVMVLAIPGMLLGPLAFLYIFLWCIPKSIYDAVRQKADK